MPASPEGATSLLLGRRYQVPQWPAQWRLRERKGAGLSWARVGPLSISEE